MKRWFYHFTNAIETEDQECDSFSKLYAYIDSCDKEGIINAPLISFTKEFIKNSFTPVLKLLCFRHFKDIYWGDVNENCFLESDNSSLKRDPMGPSANSKLFSSAHAVTKHTERRMKRLKKEATKSFQNTQHSEWAGTEAEECNNELSKKIVEYRRKMAIAQFLLSQGM